MQTMLDALIHDNLPLDLSSKWAQAQLAGQPRSKRQWQTSQWKQSTSVTLMLHLYNIIMPISFSRQGLILFLLTISFVLVIVFVLVIAMISSDP